ncbi:peptidylprolyl isomerase [Arcobacter arenosus]|jgi:peptidyl-prolyl cis-trans isomerase D|uniref:Peptidylprolyl isomerase n=1 Tax=Arcobacter arenosus TaxID=2576037 RepID=A0A5R8XYH3_9BACT|nr:peptidylprolyl isomerase [Arcobacter arenosus]TLP36168.1 peptidylprolyl isomerase [Arcobacter arenosus]
MISWMQRHKKWLVITIWISTIAFVGAGFVGWGSYDYGSKSGAVAVVGDREVTVSEYQREYSSLYDQYARIFGQQFNQEMADQLKLKEAAYNMVIQKNLILSFADEIGLDVTDEEVAKELVKIPAFIKDGKFNKDTYITVLNQNRTNPTEFEANVKRDLLLQKVEKIFSVKANKTELENLNKLLFSQDDISIKILSSNDINVTINEDELKKYWEENKDNYKSQSAISYEYDEVSLISGSYSEQEITEYYNMNKTDLKKEDGKIKSLDEAKDDIVKALDLKETKKEALKKYLAIKKGEASLTAKNRVNEIALNFGEENNKEILDAVPGDLLKPFLVDEKYIIVKITNRIPPKTLSFEDARAKVVVDFEAIQKAKGLDELAKKSLENFDGKNIGLVSRDSVDKIDGLARDEALTFLNQLFSTTQKQGTISLGEKVVVYKINSSKLASYDASKDEAVKTTMNNLYNQELMNSLVKNLENRYEVQSSVTFEE